MGRARKMAELYSLDRDVTPIINPVDQAMADGIPYQVMIPTGAEDAIAANLESGASDNQTRDYERDRKRLRRSI